MKISSVSASSGTGDTATGSFSLTNTGGSVVFVIQDDAVCSSQASIAGIGKNQTPNNHQVMLTLASTEPVTGILTVTLAGQRSSMAGSGFTTIDIGNDSDPDFQSAELEDSYSEVLTIDGSFEIRTETVTQVENINSISRSVTLTFVPTSGASFYSDGNDLMPVALGCSVVNESSVTRAETIRASIPFPRSSYQPADLQRMSIDGHQTAWMPNLDSVVHVGCKHEAVVRNIERTMLCHILSTANVRAADLLLDQRHDLARKNVEAIPLRLAGEAC